MGSLFQPSLLLILRNRPFPFTGFQALLWVFRNSGNPDPEYVEAYPTAPPLDSTWLPLFALVIQLRCGESQSFSARMVPWFVSEPRCV